MEGKLIATKKLNYKFIHHPLEKVEPLWGVSVSIFVSPRIYYPMWQYILHFPFYFKEIPITVKEI